MRDGPEWRCGTPQGLHNSAYLHNSRDGDLFGGSHGVSGSSVAINVIPILLTGSGSVEAPPTAVLSLSPSSGTLPLNVTANGTASHDSNGKPVVRSTINFGDGTTTNGLTASHIYQRA